MPRRDCRGPGHRGLRHAVIAQRLPRPLSRQAGPPPAGRENHGRGTGTPIIPRQPAETRRTGPEYHHRRADRIGSCRDGEPRAHGGVRGYIRLPSAAPREKLHRAHSGRRFDSSQPPPSARSTTWPTVPAGRPHRQQLRPCMRNTICLVRRQPGGAFHLLPLMRPLSAGIASRGPEPRTTPPCQKNPPARRGGSPGRPVDRQARDLRRVPRRPVRVCVPKPCEGHPPDQSRAADTRDTRRFSKSRPDVRLVT